MTDKTIRSAVILFSNAWGGLEKITATDIRDLAQDDKKPLVLCLKDSPIHQDLASEKSIEFLTYENSPKDVLDFRLKKDLKRIITDNKINLIHCHQPSLLGSISPWLWSDRSTVLIASRHIMTNHKKKSLYHTLLYRRLDAFVVSSEAVKENVAATHHLREWQLKVIHYGLDYERFDSDKVNPGAQRAQWGADAETVVIGIVGRIDPNKGQDVFIRAAAGTIKNLKPSDKVKFVIVGEETRGGKKGYLDELQAMVRQFRIENHVLFTGYREDVPEVMGALDLFVMPSRQEAFGMVAIEAMAMECPIIISSGGSAGEIVGNEDFGLLIRPEDAFDLQRQIRFLLDHPKLRLDMGKQARQHVLKHYDRKVRYQRTLALYEWCLERRSRL